MARITAFNRERIRWCCADIGITVEELAQELNIKSLLKAMDEQGALTVKQLEKISRFFGRDILFFMSSSPINEETAHTPQFRTIDSKKTDLSRKVKIFIRRAETQRRIYIDLMEELGNPLPRVWEGHHLNKNASDVKSFAALVRDWLSIEQSVKFNDFRQAVENKGVFVIVSNGYNGKWQIPKNDPIRGISLYYKQCPIIIIKKQNGGAAQTFSLMHELGHLLLHRSSFADDEVDFYSYAHKEKEANAFAGNVLVPDYFLPQIDLTRLENLPVDKYDDYFKKYSERWGVSVEVVLRRLLDSGEISKDDYNGYRQYKKDVIIPQRKGGGSRKYRNREPVHIFGRPYVGAVLESLAERQISLYKASTYLDNININDVHRLEGDFVSL